MKVLHFFYLLFYSIALFMPNLSGYNQPALALGQTNILDSGSHQTRLGWLWEQDFQYYYSNKFLDSNGKILEAFRNTEFSFLATGVNLFYQSSLQVFPDVRLSLSASLPFVFYATISQNKLNITSSGSGLGDFGLDAALQFEALCYNHRPIFRHKLEFDISFPTGKNNQPRQFINPGNGFLFIDPSWAATLYLTDWWALSWRIYYQWNATNHKTHIKAGDAVYVNFDTDLKVTEKLWVAVTGYFLQQLSNDRLNGVTVPNSRERVLGMGPGARYTFSKHIDFYSYLYLEGYAQNRTQGINFFSRLLITF